MAPVPGGTDRFSRLVESLPRSAAPHSGTPGRSATSMSGWVPRRARGACCRS